MILIKKKKYIKYIKFIINKGSKSFSFAIKIINRKLKFNLLMFYSFLRYCDDMIDNQLFGYNLKINTRYISNNLFYIKSKITKIFHSSLFKEILSIFFSFNELNNFNKISSIYIFDFIKGLSIEIKKKEYSSLEDTINYCYHVAGVIGIIILQIIGIYDKKDLNKACNLGIAFQLSNISRDVIKDYKLGRCYIPNIFLKKENLNKNNFFYLENRNKLVKVIKNLFKESKKYYRYSCVDINNLSKRTLLSFYLAKNIYLEISNIINNKKEKVWKNKININFFKKIYILLKCFKKILIFNDLKKLYF